MAPRSIKSWDDLDLVVGSLRVAQLLGYTVDRVQRLAKEGKIPAFRLGGSWRFEKICSTRVDQIQKKHIPRKESKKWKHSAKHLLKRS